MSGLKERLISLQSEVSRIRNICILAHVDHGKTTLADALISSNGIISSRLAGQLRYMDSRQDEQERGITMKSSAISLAYTQQEDSASPYLINLIDSPGHVDFSGEVSTAVRICDGGVVLVDVVEGVQPQTKVVLQQAWNEGISPVLVLNKIDRLITEVKLTPKDAYLRLWQVLEGVNAIIGELFASDVMGRRDRMTSVSSTHSNDGAAKNSTDKVLGADWSDGLDDVDDSELYFSPDRGNVAFASAVDGWAFCLQDFAKIYAEKLGFNEKVLTKVLWGDYCINAKTKRIMKGAHSKGKKTLFEQMILDNIWAVYDCSMINKDKDRLAKVVNALNIKVNPRDLNNTSEPHALLSSIFSKWLPLTRAVLNMVVAHVPSPDQLSQERVEKLMTSSSVKKFSGLPEATKSLKKDFVSCSSSPEAPLIVFVSKMFSVEKKQLPENRPKPLTQEELAARREHARKRHAERMAAKESGAQAVSAAAAGEQLTEEQLAKLTLGGGGTSEDNTQAVDEQDQTAFVAFARVFSGVLRHGKEAYVLGPKYDPGMADAADERLGTSFSDNKHHVRKVKLENFYLLLGKDLESLPQVPAGNIVGIGGLDEHILKSATLATDPACPPFSETVQSGVPILRVAVEAGLSTDMPKLARGLELLNQADPNVQVSMTAKGEHILVTAGEVHLERCVLDLKQTFSPGIEVVVSAPIVPFRETIIKPPDTDMVNEQLNEENKVVLTAVKDENAENPESAFEVTIQTPNKQSTIAITAYPLNKETCDLLTERSENFVLDQSFKDSLGECLKSSPHEDLRSGLSRIMSIGPKKNYTNLLINHFDESAPSLWPSQEDDVCRKRSSSYITDYLSSFINGFQLAVQAGPLCEEPLTGVAFVVRRWTVDTETVADSGAYGPLSGQIVSAVKEGCRRAFQARPQRLVAAMYSCDIQVRAEVLGRMYSVLGRRHGKVVCEDMIEGSSVFTITAHLPVIESFNFAQEVRKQTSGLAQPQLVFSHWETLAVDPFWVPQTEEEILHFGDKADSENQARKYMNEIRKRKGLAIDEKIVEFAEKQRTLTKSK